MYFYAQNEAYGEFSNFAGFGVELGGKFYPTIEHYYQAQKFENEAYNEKIRQAATPKEAADLGKTRELPLRANWDSVKSDIMWQAVQQKFHSHYDLAQMLLETDQKLLIENSPYDEYWGIGSAGQGHNHLGTLLMRMRNQLKQS
ncbi:Swarming motility protein ybiA [marine bacterium AO1-C]|nr:Swarming motility protein ybiA [marine bacterium AO1-C]